MEIEDKFTHRGEAKVHLELVKLLLAAMKKGGLKHLTELDPADPAKRFVSVRDQRRRVNSWPEANREVAGSVT